MTADERATALEAAALAAAAVRVQRRRLTTPTILMPGLRGVYVTPATPAPVDPAILARAAASTGLPPLRPTLDVDAWRARAAALVVRDAL